MVAQALARFHAPYLTGASFPDYPWPNQSFIREAHNYFKPMFHRLFVATKSTSAGRLAMLDPASSGSKVASLMRILVDPEPWLALAEGLPQTLCHQDANIDNLIWCHGPGDTVQVVAIDWQML